MDSLLIILIPLPLLPHEKTIPNQQQSYPFKKVFCSKLVFTLISIRIKARNNLLPLWSIAMTHLRSRWNQGPRWGSLLRYQKDLRRCLVSLRELLTIIALRAWKIIFHHTIFYELGSIFSFIFSPLYLIFHFLHSDCCNLLKKATVCFYT